MTLALVQRHKSHETSQQEPNSSQETFLELMRNRWSDLVFKGMLDRRQYFGLKVGCLYRGLAFQ